MINKRKDKEGNGRRRRKEEKHEKWKEENEWKWIKQDREGEHDECKGGRDEKGKKGKRRQRGK